MNVILTPTGATVIDWSNAAAGEPALDVAVTYLILAGSDFPVNGIRRPLIPILRQVMLRDLRSAWSPGTPETLPRAAAYRYRDRNLSPKEIDRLRRHIARRWPAAVGGASSSRS